MDVRRIICLKIRINIDFSPFYLAEKDPMTLTLKDETTYHKRNQESKTDDTDRDGSKY